MSPVKRSENLKTKCTYYCNSVLLINISVTEERNQGRHKQMETYTVFMDQKN